MIIRFSKTRHGPVLTCIRDAGSVTGVKPRQGLFFVRHDLMHYAVETTLELREGFYGLVAGGRSIESFADPGTAKNLPAEAITTEFIVGLFDQIANFGENPSAEHVNQTLRAMLSHRETPNFQGLTGNAIRTILERFNSLLVRYYDLPEGDRMELRFPGDGAHPASAGAADGKSASR
jgi:hypothetical protein